jgi:hypothetical protein
MYSETLVSLRTVLAAAAFSVSVHAGILYLLFLHP